MSLSATLGWKCVSKFAGQPYTIRLGGWLFAPAGLYWLEHQRSFQRMYSLHSASACIKPFRHVRFSVRSKADCSNSFLS
eukprot:2457598-Pleurochrysis_carterae.AAC.1